MESSEATERPCMRQEQVVNIGVCSQQIPLMNDGE